MFSQDLDFGDSPQYLSFNQFYLQGSHRFINSTHLHASQISVTNVLSSIQGSFNVTQSLSLESIRGPIIADIMLSPNSNQTQPTTLILGTGNSTINASITLNALTTPSVSHPPLPLSLPKSQTSMGLFKSMLLMEILRYLLPFKWTFKIMLLRQLYPWTVYSRVVLLHKQNYHGFSCITPHGL